VWMPMNYLLVQALRQYAGYFGDDFKAEYPSNSGIKMNLNSIADKLSERLISIFQENEGGHRPVNDYFTIYKDDPHFRDLILFYEYFHGDTARGIGASHQTGWTGVVAELINNISKNRKANEILTEEPILQT
jgi:hypothetical protein